MESDGAVGHGSKNLILSCFDAFGDFHFPFPGQKRNSPHFPQIHPYWVINGDDFAFLSSESTCTIKSNTVSSDFFTKSIK